MELSTLVWALQKSGKKTIGMATVAPKKAG